MEEDFHTNQKLFFRILKNLRTSNQVTRTKQIRDKNGIVLSKGNQIIDRWIQYFEELLSTSQPEELNIDKEDDGRGDQTIEEISMDEVVEAIRALKNGKAAGHDRITGEMLATWALKELKF